MKTDLISINKEQGLYVLKCGAGFTCLGFQVSEDRTARLSDELKIHLSNARQGTKKHYQNYVRLTREALKRYQQTGWRSSSELNPKLIGLEGKRIECTLHGEKTRFIVGKSTGWIPCHIKINTSRSMGGMSVTSDPDSIQNIRVIDL
jgi:hypothetical protein